MAKSIDIFYKTYKPDFWLLYLSLATLKKNVTGYNKVVILVPETEKEFFETRNLPERTEVHYIQDKAPGWLYQQVCKLNAYKYCFAEFILFADSDCIWDHPVDLQEFVADGKPEILYTDYAQLPDAIIWKAPTEKFIKEPVQFEMMRRNCQIHYRQTLIDIAAYEPNLEAVVMSSNRFSEFNAMAVFAKKYCPDRYKFVNTDDWTYVPPLAIQVWSHASKEKGADDLHLREYIRILETILKSNGIDMPQ